MSLPIGTIAAFGPFIEYLRPAKSPYLLMVIFGTIATITTSFYFQTEHEWLMLIIPQFIALVVFNSFAYFGRDEHTEDEQEEQLRFSRAVSIAAALMCLAFGAKEVLGRDALFNVNYLACIFQLAIFVIYAAARLYKEEKPENFNFFQFSFITSVYLVGATIALSLIDYDDETYLFQTVDDGENEKQIVDPFLITSTFLYLLWALCQVYWVRRIFSLVVISVRDD
ncbi:MAG: hypothetical protein AAF434_12505 [Pseudomonadota bacterium]